MEVRLREVTNKLTVHDKDRSAASNSAQVPSEHSSKALSIMNTSENILVADCNIAAGLDDTLVFYNLCREP